MPVSNSPCSVRVDSNVLLDIVTGDPTWGAWSRRSLERAADEAALVINALVYAELSTGFASIEALEEALPPELYRREHLPYEAAFLAGKAFVRYRHAGGAKKAPLPDFYIGAHAAVAGYWLLTRDARRYRTLLPNARAYRAGRLSRSSIATAASVRWIVAVPSSGAASVPLDGCITGDTFSGWTQ